MEKHLDALLELNESKSSPLLFKCPERHLYVDKRGGDQETMARCGITKLLKKRSYSNFRAVNNTPQNRRSGVASGRRFHEHIYHALTCVPLSEEAKREAEEKRKRAIAAYRKKHAGKEMRRPPSVRYKSVCKCEDKFGGNKKRKTRSLKPGSCLSRWISAAQAFLHQNKLEPVACEVIVSCPESLTTEVDLLALKSRFTSDRCKLEEYSARRSLSLHERRKLLAEGAYTSADYELVNVSWKTGYSVRTLDTPRTIDSSGRMRGVAAFLPNTEHQQHRLQQLIENSILLHGHNLTVERNYIVYAGAYADSHDRLLIKTYESSLQQPSDNNTTSAINQQLEELVKDAHRAGSQSLLAWAQDRA